MFTRLVGESFVRNPRRKILTAAALVVGMAVATATLTVALEVGDRLAREFRSLGANLLVTPQSDSLPLEIGGVDYRPVDEGAYLREADLGKLKTIFWRHNILGFTPFLDVPVSIRASAEGSPNAKSLATTLDRHVVRARCAGAGRNEIQDRLERRRIPGGKFKGRWFREGENECVLGAAFAATLSRRHRAGENNLRERAEPAPSGGAQVPMSSCDCHRHRLDGGCRG